jgi:hypothetical protein
MQGDHDIVSDQAKGYRGNAIAFRWQISHVWMEILVVDIEWRFGVPAGNIH